jgi:hypothetical protein
MRNLIPPAIVEKYVAEEPDFSLKPQRNFNSTKEVYEWAFFHLSNPYRGEDGRTYYGIAADGTYLSHYVSQYSKIIDDNLEPKIAPVVKALHARKYLTSASCQGHKRGDRRWVSVLFFSEALKEKFREDLRTCRVPIAFDTVHPRPRDPKDQNKLLEYDEQYLTDMWNAQVCRRYEKFYHIRFTIGNTAIGDVLGAYGNLWERIKFHTKRLWFDYFVRTFLLDKYTKRVADHILKFDDYPM